MDIVGAMGDPNLFGRSFPGPTWDGWRAVLRAAFALPMTAGERAFFRTVADRDPPKKRVRELWVVAGRRAGKDSIASVIAAHTAAMFDGRAILRPGERALVQCLACDRDQSRIVLGYTRAFFDSPILRKLVVRDTADGLELKNNVDIVVATNNFRSARGRTVLCAIFDEVAFWRSELTTSPDEETYRAIRPGLATLSEAMLIGISSPYRKSGLLYAKFKKYFGCDDDDVLVIRAPTAALNPTISPSVIAAAIEDDSAAARSEWLGEFRDDIGGYADLALIEAAVDQGVTVRPPVKSVRYVSFCDPSGGSRDSFTAAVAHAVGNVAVLDALIEIKAPLNPVTATEQVAALLKSYGLRETVSDKYAAGFAVDAFARCGVKLWHSERDRSALYLECLPLFTSGRTRLIDNRRMVTQFASLERRTSPIGKDRVDHGPGGQDDLCNAAAGALVLAVAVGPALWRTEGFLIEGAPVPMPARCDCVFTVLMAGQSGQAAVIYFGKCRMGRLGDGPLLVICDCEAAPLAPALFHRIAARLTELATATRARGAFLFTCGALAGEVRRLGYPAQVIDRLTAEDDGLLALAAAVHIGAGRVKITAEALAKAEYHPLGGILDATVGDEDDPLRVAALVGIALALDTGRSLA